MFDFRFFEIYRSSEYMSLIFDGILISSSLTIISGGLGFIIAFIYLIVYVYNGRKNIIAEEPLITNLMDYEPPNEL